METAGVLALVYGKVSPIRLSKLVLCSIKFDTVYRSLASEGERAANNSVNQFASF